MWIFICQMMKDDASFLAFATNDIACYTCIGIALGVAAAITLTKGKGADLGKKVPVNYILLAIYTVCITYSVGVLAAKTGTNRVYGALAVTMTCSVAIILATDKTVALLEKIYESCSCCQGSATTHRNSKKLTKEEKEAERKKK